MNDKAKNVEVTGVRTVTSNSLITAKGLNDLSLKARKLLYIALSQSRRNDSDFYTYEISVKEFADLMGITAEAVYPEADKITDELLKGVLKVMKKDESQFEKYALFSKCQYNHNGSLSFKLNPDMTDFLLNLQGDFSQPLLEDFLKMKSSYSIAIWHIMQREMRSKKPVASGVITFNLTVDELRAATGTENKLKKISQFKERCLDKAIKEIENNCMVKITYEPVKKGRSIKSFNFTAVSVNYIPDEKLSKKTREKLRMHELLMIHKKRNFTIEEENEYIELLQKYPERDFTNYYQELDFDFSDPNKKKK